MKRSIINYINKLQSYKTAIKNIHWSSQNMSEHKLFDDIEETVSNTQDDIAEISQGIFGKLKFNDLRPKRYNITTSKKMLQDLLSDSKTFLSTLRNKELIGIKSIMENFIGEIDQFIYLHNFCIKEDLKRRITRSINENKKFIMTESELRNIVREAIKKAIK